MKYEVRLVVLFKGVFEQEDLDNHVHLHWGKFEESSGVWLLTPAMKHVSHLFWIKLDIGDPWTPDKDIRVSNLYPQILSQLRYVT